MAHHGKKFSLGIGGNLRSFLSFNQLTVDFFQFLRFLLQQHRLHLMLFVRNMHIDEALDFGLQNLRDEGFDHIINSTGRIPCKQMLCLFAVCGDEDDRNILRLLSGFD
ncbi:hypothetical protein D3C75_659440 [compost metagenome]